MEDLVEEMVLIMLLAIQLEEQQHNLLNQKIQELLVMDLQVVQEEIRQLGHLVAEVEHLR
jgi:hypothetical protein